MTTLTRQLGKRRDDAYWRGCLENEDRRYRELMVRYDQKTGDLAAAQLKYQQLKERVVRKATQAGHRVSGSIQPPAAQPAASAFQSLDTLFAIDALAGSAGAGPQRSLAPEGSFTSRPPLSGQRRRREEHEQQPRQEEEERERVRGAGRSSVLSS